MRAMPSPTCSTVPTSARSVSTSYSSIRCFRIEVISSGRSFMRAPLYQARCTQLSAEPVEPAAHAGVDAMRADLEDDAADQVGVDRAGRLDLPARGLLDLRRRSRRASSSESSYAVVSSTWTMPARLGDEPLELAPRSPRPLPRGPSRTSRSRKLRTQLVGAARARPRARRAFARGSSCGLRSSSRELRHLALGLDESAELLADRLELALLLRGLEERLRVRRGATTLITRSALSSTEKSSSPIASSISALVVGVVERPCRSPSVAASRLRSATSARICSSARRVSASICLRVSSSRRWRSASISSRIRALAGLGDACAPRRGSPRRRSSRLPSSLRCSSSSLRASSRARSASSSDCADPLAPLVDRLLDRAEREALEHEERDQEADDRPDHQPRRDLDQRRWLRAASA